MSCRDRQIRPADAAQDAPQDLIRRAKLTLLGASRLAEADDYEGVVNRLKLTHDLVGQALTAALAHDGATRIQR